MTTDHCENRLRFFHNGPVSCYRNMNHAPPAGIAQNRATAVGHFFVKGFELLRRLRLNACRDWTTRRAENAGLVFVNKAHGPLDPTGRDWRVFSVSANNILDCENNARMRRVIRPR